MKLEDQVCSLELSKRLKELGVKQESVFWWAKDRYKSEKMNVVYGKEWFSNYTDKPTHEISAFTVAELGEMLPLGMYCMKVKEIGNIKWKCNFISKYVILEANTEANARAKMLIYLKEKGLLK